MTNPPRFDPTVNLGHIITACTFLLLAGGTWYVTDYRLTIIERQLERLAALVVDNARIDERLKALERR